MKHFLVLALVMLIVATGCEKRLELGQVTGQVTLDGKPLDGVIVKFMPDPEQGNTGPSSIGRSDEQGNYELFVAGDATRPGAVTGWHRVIVQDPRREDRPPGPLRVTRRFNVALETPLRFEIQSDAQSIALELTRK